MEIRRFNNRDQTEVKKLITEILSNEFLMDQRAYAYSDLDSISNVYGGAKEGFFVGEEKGKVVGTIGVKEESKDIAILRRLFINPKYRGKGFGRLLVDKALAFCREKGYKQAIFHVSTNMKTAMDLSKKAGFKEKERLNLGGIDIVRLVLALGVK